MPEYLDIKQAAAYLSVHPQTLRRWEQQGLIRPARIGPARRRRYTKQQLDAVAAR
jgi:excisionase family DNA binding protein